VIVTTSLTYINDRHPKNGCYPTPTGRRRRKLLSDCDNPMFAITKIVNVCRSIIFAGVIPWIGCQTETQRPDFLARSHEDCALGDLPACSMLDALQVRSAIAGPTKAQPQRTQVQRDTDAIMNGRSKGWPPVPSKELEVAPTTPLNELLSP
jgi:hypothetical protein